jgi:hypothetical protein
LNDTEYFSKILNKLIFKNEKEPTLFEFQEDAQKNKILNKLYESSVNMEQLSKLTNDIRNHKNISFKTTTVDELPRKEEHFSTKSYTTKKKVNFNNKTLKLVEFSKTILTKGIENLTKRIKRERLINELILELQKKWIVKYINKLPVVELNSKLPKNTLVYVTIFHNEETNNIELIIPPITTFGQVTITYQECNDINKINEILEKAQKSLINYELFDLILNESNNEDYIMMYSENRVVMKFDHSRILKIEKVSSEKHFIDIHYEIQNMGIVKNLMRTANITKFKTKESLEKNFISFYLYIKHKLFLNDFYERYKEETLFLLKFNFMSFEYPNITYFKFYKNNQYYFIKFFDNRIQLFCNYKKIDIALNDLVSFFNF